jgi:hypothetical protein
MPEKKLLDKKILFPSFFDAQYILNVKSKEDFEKKILLIILKSQTIKDLQKDYKRYSIPLNAMKGIFVIYFTNNSILYYHRIEVDFLRLLDKSLLDRIYDEFSYVLSIKGNKGLSIIEILNLFKEKERNFMKIIREKDEKNKRGNKQT